MIYLLTTSTDCDHCTATCAKEFFYQQDCQAYMDQRLEWAEGPTYFEYITRREYEEFYPTVRDGILEAFEDGHAHCVYG